MRPHAFKMPLQVKLRVFEQDEQTVEFPDDATGLTVKEWVYESFGVHEPAQRLVAVQRNTVLKNEVLLSSDPKFLHLRVIPCPIGT